MQAEENCVIFARLGKLLRGNNAERLHLPNMAALSKFGYIPNRDTNNWKERRYQCIKHPIITVIAWFSFRGKQRKCRRVQDPRTAYFT